MDVYLVLGSDVHVLAFFSRNGIYFFDEAILLFSFYLLYCCVERAD